MDSIRTKPDEQAFAEAEESMVWYPKHGSKLMGATAGCDLLLCLPNPYKMTHEQVMSSIEMFGRHIIPEIDGN